MENQRKIEGLIKGEPNGEAKKYGGLKGEAAD